MFIFKKELLMKPKTSNERSTADPYRNSRVLYCIEAALEYFIAIMVGETYLAKIAEELGASDALTGVLYAFVSLGSAFQIFAILLSDRTPVKRWVTPLHILNQIFFTLVYAVPLFSFAKEVKIAFFAAFLLLQGTETLSLRLERHAENTKKVVAFLANHPQVETVNHPSLPDHPNHALYEKYFPNGGASIFTFEIKGSQREAHKFIDSLKIFSLLANVADVKSLVIHPATTTHSQLSEKELLDQGIKPNTIRLSIGTEHIDDIIADLEKGFEAVK